MLVDRQLSSNPWEYVWISPLLGLWSWGIQRRESGKSTTTSNIYAVCQLFLMSTKEVLKLVARLIDLTRAYKQLARQPSDAYLAIFAVQNESGEWEYYESLSLGFGARNAVLGFNLMARALRHILNEGLWIAATHFYDDFSQIEPDCFALDSCASTEKLFQLLGWEYKADADNLFTA